PLVVTPYSCHHRCANRRNLRRIDVPQDVPICADEHEVEEDLNRAHDGDFLQKGVVDAESVRIKQAQPSGEVLVATASEQAWKDFPEVARVDLCFAAVIRNLPQNGDLVRILLNKMVLGEARLNV